MRVDRLKDGLKIGTRLILPIGNAFGIGAVHDDARADRRRSMGEGNLVGEIPTGLVFGSRRDGRLPS